VLKKRDSKEKKEDFFCRIKGGIVIDNGQKQFMVIYMHSLKIHLLAIPEHLEKYSEEAN